MAHGHGHAHGHGQGHAQGAGAGQNHAHGQSSGAALGTAFAITASILVLEAVGGLWVGSVALLADAGHMLTDAGALGIALLGSWLASRPRATRQSFGHGRAEILAALVNGVLLGGVSVGIAIEGIERLVSAEAREIDAGPMIAIAVVGLGANLASAALLARSARDNLNVRAALLHVLGDALGSVAAITAGVCVLIWGWTLADSVAGLLIAALLVISSWRLLRESVDILLESAPRGLDLEEIAGRVRSVEGVADIHDLHIWTVTSGFVAMSAHVDLSAGAAAEAVRRAIHKLLHQDYGVGHTTIQTEEAPALLEIEAPPSQ